MNENKKEKNVKKRRRIKIKTGYIFALIIIAVVLFSLVKIVLPSNGSSKYGDRLDGIKDITFGKTEKNKIIKAIEDNDKVTEAKIHVSGKIINIIYNVKKDVSKDDARKIADESLKEISDKVKGFYDIQFMISKKDEEGKKEKKVNDDGTTEEVVKTEFPIMGYKNSKSSKIVW